MNKGNYMTRCGDMTYASYMMRVRGECNERKETMQLNINGVVMNGTPEQLAEIARKLGHDLGNDGVFYLSDSRGLVKIVDMDESWLRNAIAKRYRNWANTLNTLAGVDFVRAVTNGPNDATTKAMVVQHAQLVRKAQLKTSSSTW